MGSERRQSYMCKHICTVSQPWLLVVAAPLSAAKERSVKGMRACMG